MDINQVDLARTIALKFHAGQKYGEHSYSYHLESVAYKTGLAYPGDERLMAIAWLHDILEDTHCTLEVLQALFDDDIVAAVQSMTKKPTDTRDDYLINLRCNPLARKVKLCDAFCNLEESLIRNDERRIKRYGETLAMLAKA